MNTPLSDEMMALLNYANETTEGADSNLGDAVKTLCDGYGKGGGGNSLKVQPHTEYEWGETSDTILATGLPFGNYILEIKFGYTQEGLNDVSPFGIWSDGISYVMTWWSNAWSVGLGNGSLRDGVVGRYPTASSPSVIRYNDHGRIIQDGSEITSGLQVPDYEENQYNGRPCPTLPFFCRTRGGYETRAAMRIYYAKMFTQDGELMHHLVPATNYVGKGGLYDKVCGGFYGILDNTNYTAKGPVVGND